MPSETFRFTKGQTLPLDEIYSIQGLAGGDWWDFLGGDFSEETVTITRSITIKISYTENKRTG